MNNAIKLISSLSIGLLCLITINIFFSISSSALSSYIVDLENLNENSWIYLLLGLHDSLLVIVASSAILITLKAVLKLNRKDYTPVFFAQTPVSIGFYIMNGAPVNFNSMYESQQSFVTITGMVSIVFLFILTRNLTFKRNIQ